MKTVTITVTWKAFADRLGFGERVTSATVEFDVDDSLTDIDICDIVFHDTNVYSGALWNALEPLLPEDRTHTALSVGDEVTINNETTYFCDHFGWEVLEKENAQ